MLDRIDNIIQGPDIPKLYIAQGVINKMARAAQQYIEDETGEAMIGLIIKDKMSEKTSIYIMDTIAPGVDAVRESHTFQQGNAWQDDVLHWLRQNWQVARRKRVGSYGNATAAKWDSSLFHLGDWHKQPGFMIQPSMGDLHTAMEWIYQAGNQLGFVVAPILTIDHPATVTAPDETSNFIRVEQPNGLMTRIDFWYIARHMNSFHAIVPNIVEDKIFPRLMEYPWHLVSEQRAYQEMTLLEDDGMMVETLLWDTDEELPLEVCFLTARPGASHFLLIATPHNYPFAMPDIYTVPFASIQPNEGMYDLLDRVWTHAELVEDPEDFEWTPQKTLLEYVYLAEETLGWTENRLDLYPEETEDTLPQPIEDKPAAEATSDTAVSEKASEVIKSAEDDSDDEKPKEDLPVTGAAQPDNSDESTEETDEETEEAAK